MDLKRANRRSAIPSSCTAPQMKHYVSAALATHSSCIAMSIASVSPLNMTTDDRIYSLVIMYRCRSGPDNRFRASHRRQRVIGATRFSRIRVVRRLFLNITKIRKIRRLKLCRPWRFNHNSRDILSKIKFLSASLSNHRSALQ